MNIGQILETHLGWASASLGKQVNDMIEKIQNEGQTNDLKDKLLDIYDSDTHQKIIKKMGDDQILELANNLKDGIFQHLYLMVRKKRYLKSFRKSGVSVQDKSAL